jgi:hypothetical protein
MLTPSPRPLPTGAVAQKPATIRPSSPTSMCATQHPESPDLQITKGEHSHLPTITCQPVDTPAEEVQPAHRTRIWVATTRSRPADEASPTTLRQRPTRRASHMQGHMPNTALTGHPTGVGTVTQDIHPRTTPKPIICIGGVRDTDTIARLLRLQFAEFLHQIQRQAHNPTFGPIAPKSAPTTTGSAMFQALVGCATSLVRPYRASCPTACRQTGHEARDKTHTRTCHASVGPENRCSHPDSAAATRNPNPTRA